MRLLLLLILLVTSLFSKPFVTTNYNYYNIYPTNPHKLEDNMDKTSPINVLGSIRHGTINWKLKYFYKKQKSGNLCYVADVKTKLDVLYTVPKISKTYKTSKKMKKAFNRYYVLLEEYLNKQRNFAVMAAQEIEDELIKISLDDNNCELIKSDVKKVANKIIKKYKKKNKNYEIRTYEGFLDSVRFEKL